MIFLNKISTLAQGINVNQLKWECTSKAMGSQTLIKQLSIRECKHKLLTKFNIYQACLIQIEN